MFREEEFELLESKTLYISSNRRIIMQASSSAADMEDDLADDLPAFKRGVHSQSSAFQRLSSVLRRSLRLPGRSPQPQVVSAPNQEDFDWQRKIKENAQRFTENSDTYIGSSSLPSRLNEIKENRRLNRVEKVKKIVRKSDWPTRHEVRKELWRELCRGKDFDSSKAVFRDQLNEVTRSGRVKEGREELQKYISTLAEKASNPLFLNEDGVVINNFELNEQGTMRLLRLLKVIENMRPEISSAPMLYPLCALMLHYLEDADVFACVNQLLASKGYLMTSPLEWAASSHTILALVKKHKPSAYTALKRRVGSQDDVILVKTMRDWLTWIFHGLPMSHAVRVVDCYLVEGSKFVIRAAIATVYIWSKGLKSEARDDLSGKSIEERVDAVRGELQAIAQQMQISTETFIATCTRIRNLQSSNIARIQSHYEDRLRDEVTREQTNKKASRKAISRLFCKPFESRIIDSEAVAEIIYRLPARLQLQTPELLFRLSQDGASFTKLWFNIENADQSLLLIRTCKGDIFGAYCSASWLERNDRKERTKSKYFGTGESFVWRLDKETELPVPYEWVGKDNENADNCPQMFMSAKDRLMVIGSGDGDAIRIEEELTRGMSSACRTFGSPALVDNRMFEIDELEVFSVMTGATTP